MLQLPILLLQMSVILVVARLVGWILRKIQQPQVVGEMVAGILLGPSLLGWLSPSISAALFPTASLGFLNAFSQVGLILFMFLVGLELNLETLRQRVHIAVVISHVSIIVPFIMGALLALYLYPRLSSNRVPFNHFVLFLGTAMSITAFPVLARILAERNLLHTPVGTVAIACAAVDDVTAWCILAGVVLLVRVSDAMLPLWAILLGTATYIGMMLFGARRVLYQLRGMYRRRGTLTPDILAICLLLVLVSASITEWLGIHALFGAFLAGVIIPKDREFVHALAQKLEDLTVVLLLPLFFAFTGLRTRIGLLNGLETWFYCGLIIAVALAGKFGGSTLAARVTGRSWRDAGTIGILMNTRGLIELVALNIGFDLGLISPTLFTMLVIMALVTTFMTTPLLAWIYKDEPHRDAAAERTSAITRKVQADALHVGTLDDESC